MSEEADHLMQLHAAVDDGRHGNHGAHVGVHLLVHQPERKGFVPYQSLRENKRFHTQDFMVINCAMATM